MSFPRETSQAGAGRRVEAVLGSGSDVISAAFCTDDRAMRAGLLRPGQGARSGAGCVFRALWSPCGSSQALQTGAAPSWGGGGFCPGPLGWWVLSCCGSDTDPARSTLLCCVAGSLCGWQTPGVCFVPPPRTLTRCVLWAACEFVWRTMDTSMCPWHRPCADGPPWLVSQPCPCGPRGRPAAGGPLASQAV